MNEEAALTTVSRHSRGSLSAGAVFSRMRRETASAHLGDRAYIKAVQRDLAERNSGWLRTAAKAMAKHILVDWKE